jgi:hypothetical protein
MTNDYFNDHTGLKSLEWWTGQVVDEKNWAGNENDKIHKRDDIPGWGKRYKVRIFGRDPKQKDTKDDELEMAEVLYPVTAGSGHAGATHTANIRQGTYVVGYYKDGVDATEPIIMGVLGNNSQTRLYGGDPSEGFIPRTGFKGLNGDKKVSTKNMYAEGPSSIPFFEGIDLHGWLVHLVDQVKDGSPCEFIPKIQKCEGPSGGIRGIQSAIKNALALINRIKAEANSFMGAVSNLTSSINNVISSATGLITQMVKNIIDKMRGYVVNKINAGISDLMNLLPPNKRPGANEKAEKTTDILQCVFNKIIKGLLSLVEKLLRDIIDQYINAPMCAAEQFLANLLSSILGTITSAIDSALSGINSIFGAAMNFVGKVLDVLDIVSGVLKFLSCDEEQDCSMGDQWSFWNGASCVLDKVSAGLSSITSALAGAGSSAPPCNTSQLPCGPPNISISGFGGGDGALANPIISATGSILGIDLVSGGRGYTSPPNVIVTQNCNNGNGAVIRSVIGTNTDTTTTINDGNGNTITITGGTTTTSGDTTTITGGTTTTNGNSTITDSTATINDGNGNTITITGGTATIGEDTTTITGGTTTTENIGNGSVIGFEITDPGTGYLPAPDGSTGGDRIKLSEPCDTIVKKVRTGYEKTKKPGKPVRVRRGDIVYLPPSTVVQVFNSKGVLVQTLNGLGQLTPITIKSSGTFTAPNCVDDIGLGSSVTTSPLVGPRLIGIPIGRPTIPTSLPIIPTSRPTIPGRSYPVVLKIGKTIIKDPGVNYDPTDPIVIFPDNGAVLIPKYDDAGSLIDVAIENPGIGFTDYPNIYIDSVNGINAEIIPQFEVIRLGDLSQEKDIVPTDAQIIHVVDCVGKIAPKTTFDIVPR